MKRILSCSVVAALAAGLLAAAPAEAARVSGVPLDCSGYARGVDASGNLTTFRYENGATSWTGLSPDSYGFQPIALAAIGQAGDDTSFFSNDFAVKKDGSVHDVYRRAVKQSNGTFKIVERRQPRVATGWESTRAIANTGSHLYRLTNQGLYRYKITYSQTSRSYRLGARQTIKSSGLSGYKTLASARQSSTHVVLRSTTGLGRLSEIVIPLSKITSPTFRVVRSSGFANVTSLGFGFCSSSTRSKARTIVTATKAGAIRVHYEPTFDANGADITGGGNATTGVTRRIFGQ